MTPETISIVSALLTLILSNGAWGGFLSIIILFIGALYKRVLFWGWYVEDLERRLKRETDRADRLQNMLLTNTRQLRDLTNRIVPELPGGER